MRGYVRPVAKLGDGIAGSGGQTGTAPAEYRSFIESLMRVLVPLGPIKQYQFGETVVELADDTRFDVFSPRSYYATTTRIDRVIERVGDRNMTLIVTDLLQKEDDVLTLVSALMKFALDQERVVGVIALRAAYHGNIDRRDLGARPGPQRRHAHTIPIDRTVRQARDHVCHIVVSAGAMVD